MAKTAQELREQMEALQRSWRKSNRLNMKLSMWRQKK